MSWLQHYPGLLKKVELEHPCALPRALKEFERSACVYARFRSNHYPAIGNVIYSREVLYRILGVEKDEEAYMKIIDAMAHPLKVEEEKFTDYYVHVEIVKSSLLPYTRFYECDGGPYLTGGVVIACDKRGEICNASIHRAMILDEKRWVIRVSPRHLYKLLSDHGWKLPIAYVFGSNPLVMLAASTSPPFGVFELNVAKALGWRGSVCRTPLYNIPVPCDAAVVVEGVLGPERELEGPFTDILMLCDKPRREPLFKLEALYINKYFEPLIWQVLPASVEHKLLMGFPREVLIWDYVRKIAPSVVKVRLTEGGGGWLHAVIAVKGVDKEVAKNVIIAAFAAHPSLKHVVVVDEDIDVDDPQQVEWAIATRFQADEDLVIICGAKGSSLDPSGFDKRGVCKVGLVAVIGNRDERLFRRPRLVS